MVAKRQPVSKATQEQLDREERARLIVAKVRANKQFMAGVREGFESHRNGTGVPFDEIKRGLDPL